MAFYHNDINPHRDSVNKCKPLMLLEGSVPVLDFHTQMASCKLRDHTLLIYILKASMERVPTPGWETPISLYSFPRNIIHTIYTELLQEARALPVFSAGFCSLMSVEAPQREHRACMGMNSLPHLFQKSIICREMSTSMLLIEV